MGTIIGIISALIAIFAIKLQFFSKPREEFEHLRVQFKATQRLSLEVQIELEELITKNNAWESEIFPGIKYGAYLDEMKQSFNKNLSDSVYSNLETLNLTKSTIASMTKSLEDQFGALSQMQSQTRLFSRQFSNI
jgi:hypothetical protein